MSPYIFTNITYFNKACNYNVKARKQLNKKYFKIFAHCTERTAMQINKTSTIQNNNEKGGSFVSETGIVLYSYSRKYDTGSVVLSVHKWLTLTITHTHA